MGHIPQYARIETDELFELILCVMIMNGKREILPDDSDVNRMVGALGHKLTEECVRLQSEGDASVEMKASRNNLLHALGLFDGSPSTGAFITFWHELRTSPFIQETRVMGRTQRYSIAIALVEANRRLAKADPAWREFLERELPPLIVEF